MGQVKELIGRCERLEKHRGVLLVRLFGVLIKVDLVEETDIAVIRKKKQNGKRKKSR